MTAGAGQGLSALAGVTPAALFPQPALHIAQDALPQTEAWPRGPPTHSKPPQAPPPLIKNFLLEYS